MSKTKKKTSSKKVTKKNQANQFSNYGEKAMQYISYCFVTRYNWSLIIIGLLIWFFSCYLNYCANANFDMIVTVNNYIFAVSLASIIIGIAREGDIYRHISKLALMGIIICLFSIMMIKSILLSKIGVFLIMPVNIFIFLLIVKNLWLANDQHKSS